MEGGFVTFFEQLKDPLLMFMTLVIIAVGKAYISERSERREKDHEKDEQFKELVSFGKDVVKLTTIWEEKAKDELIRTDAVEHDVNEKFSKILQLLQNMKGTLQALTPNKQNE